MTTSRSKTEHYDIYKALPLERGTPLQRAHFGFDNSPVQKGDRLAHRETGELVTLDSSSTFNGRSTIWVIAPYKGKIETHLGYYNFHQKMPR